MIERNPRYYDEPVWEVPREEWVAHKLGKPELAGAHTPEAYSELWDTPGYTDLKQKHSHEVYWAFAMGEIDYDTASKQVYGMPPRDHVVSLPEVLYHTATDVPAIVDIGIMTRYELGQHQSGALGLGGGPDDTISFTTSRSTAIRIWEAFHELHDLLNDRITVLELMEMAKRGDLSDRPFLHDIMHGNYKTMSADGSTPRSLAPALTGVHYGTWHAMTRDTEFEWHPVPESKVPGYDLYSEFWRDATPEEIQNNKYEFYGRFSWFREMAGGPENPLFHCTNVQAFAELDPSKFGVLQYAGKPGTRGYRVSALGEIRTWTGDAVELTGVLDTGEWRWQ